MVLDYLKRGFATGAVGGVAFGLYVAFVANPLVTYVDDLAHGGHAAEAGHSAEPAVSVAVTKLVSVGSGLFWGLLFGVAAFGIAFYFLEPSIPGGPDAKPYLLAGAGFGGMMVAGALACGLAGAVYNRLAARGGRLRAAGAAVLPFGLLAVPVLLAPANPVTGSVPGHLAAAVRGLTVFSQLGLWFALASAHAWLDRRAGEAGIDIDAPVTDAPAAAD
ncbi:hypothetical protein BRC83_03745 [Halobacteriales archaeon QS_1_68_17]|nr:MAG: hypothetical protein BRC83_03745 [Halobacteriales archaeon QS_1_68_17]